MPKIGDVCRASDLGMAGTGLMVYSSCQGCGTEAWKRKSSADKLCPKCSHQREHDSSLEAKRASELGYRVSGKDYLLYKDICPDCGTEVWRRKDAIGKRCAACSQKAIRRHTGPEHPRWVNGQHLNKHGYVVVTINKDDPAYPMANKRTHEILEHRLVMSRHLGRCLKPWEIVHHVNRVRNDNRIENLELIAHQHTHQSVGIADRVEDRIRRLETMVDSLSLKLARCEALLAAYEHGNPELSVSSSNEDSLNV